MGAAVVALPSKMAEAEGGSEQDDVSFLRTVSNGTGSMQGTKGKDTHTHTHTHRRGLNTDMFACVCGNEII